MTLKPSHLFQGIVILSVFVATIVGFFLIGTPSQQRARKFDQQRTNDLQQLSTAIDAYYNFNNNYTLPESLGQLQNQTGIYVGSIADPRTGEIYDYHPTGLTSYVLCPTFETDTLSRPHNGYIQYPPYKMIDAARHQAGKVCVTQDVQRWPTP